MTLLSAVTGADFQDVPELYEATTPAPLNSVLSTTEGEAICK